MQHDHRCLTQLREESVHWACVRADLSFWPFHYASIEDYCADCIPVLVLTNAPFLCVCVCVSSCCGVCAVECVAGCCSAAVAGGCRTTIFYLHRTNFLFLNRKLLSTAAVEEVLRSFTLVKVEILWFDVVRGQFSLSTCFFSSSAGLLQLWLWVYI